MIVKKRPTHSLNDRIKQNIEEAPFAHEIVTYAESTTTECTKGRTYQVIETDGNLIAILDDNGKRRWKSRDRFH